MERNPTSTLITPGPPNGSQSHPARDITHTYTSPATGIKLRVDTTYTIRYRIGDGTWFTLADTLTITGPTTGLEVHEARPYLTKPRA